MGDVGWDGVWAVWVALIHPLNMAHVPISCAAAELPTSLNVNHPTLPIT